MSENKTQDQGGPDETITPGSPLPHPHDPDAPRVGPTFPGPLPHPHDPDAPRVGPTLAGPFAIGGGVKGVNDAGSQLVYVRITRYEAELLLRHWFERMRDAYEFCFVYEMTGSEEQRVIHYANYRLDVLASHVSAALLDELREEARRRDATLEADREAYRRFLEADSEANCPALDADEEGDEFADEEGDEFADADDCE